MDATVRAAQELASLFIRGPTPALPAAGGVGLVSPELREQLQGAAAKALRRFPRRSSPGPNGSRFEHWGVLTSDEAALREGIDLIVDFLLGECPAEALQANLGARLLGLRKPTGRLRPLALGSVVRRLAARAACTVLKPHLAGAVGPHQYGVGRRAGCELMHKCVSALADEDPRRVVVAFDACNAFGSMPRAKVWEGVLSRAPDLATTTAAWLGRTTEHVHWDERGRAVGISTTAGVDRGCPLSPLLFALGLAATLDDIATQLRALDGSARVFAYLDDVVVVVSPEQAAGAYAIVERCLGACGLALNSDKTQVWSRD